MKDIKRFRVIDADKGYETVNKSDDLQEIVEWLLVQEDLQHHRYEIEDLLDEIKQEAWIVIKAWEEGERPGDLQMF